MTSGGVRGGWGAQGRCWNVRSHGLAVLFLLLSNRAHSAQFFVPGYVHNPGNQTVTFRGLFTALLIFFFTVTKHVHKLDVLINYLADNKLALARKNSGGSKPLRLIHT